MWNNHMQANNSSNHLIISGGTQGLGLAVAKVMVQQGCKAIIITGRNAQKGETAAAEISTLGAACDYITCDVGQEDDCHRLIDQALDRFGTINALVNCAAITTRGSILDTTPKT